jgi:uncharacterized protein (DUF2235 family)
MAQTVRRLVACFDGTWNNDRSNTNVSRLFRKVSDATNGCPEQLRFYDEGVGTRFGERIRGGVLGMGLDRNIRQGYAWLASNFTPRDTAKDAEGFLVGTDLYLLGFSRGAFTARSLGGLINYLGLPKLSNSPPAGTPLADHPQVKAAWELYANRPTVAQTDQIKQGNVTDDLRAHLQAVGEFRANDAVYPVRIHFLGVWDTVGALGIPQVLDYRWLPRPSNKYRFHDTSLGRCVRFAYHAVAIDENREAYCVTLWSGRESSTEEVEQRWFPGAHADVGGGYDDDLLPDPPLAWIASRAAYRGLSFVNDRQLPDPTGRVLPFVAKPPAAFDLDGREYLSPVHDSYAEFMLGAYRLLRALPGAGGRVYRRMLVEADGIFQTVDPTAHQKVDADPNYRPPNLAQAGRPDVSFTQAFLDAGAANAGQV